MKIAKALKLKNKIAGDLNRLQQHIEQQNVIEGENKSEFDVEKLFQEYKDKQQKLIGLKTGIARSNSEIVDKIFLLSELKSRIQFMKKIQSSVKDGSFKETVGFRDAEVERKYTSILKKERLEKEILECELLIETTQEVLDNFNFTHTIVIPVEPA